MKRFLTIQSLNWHTQYKRNPETSHGVLSGLDCSALVALWFCHKSVTLHWPSPIFVAFQSRQKRIDKLVIFLNRTEHCENPKEKSSAIQTLHNTRHHFNETEMMAQSQQYFL